MDNCTVLVVQYVDCGLDGRSVGHCDSAMHVHDVDSPQDGLTVFLKKGFSRHTHTSVHVVRTFRTPKHEVVVYTGIVSRDWRMEKEDIYFLRLQLKGLFVHGSYSKDNVRDWKTFSFFSA